MSPFLVLLPGVRPSEPMLFGKPRDKFLLLGANRDDQRARSAFWVSERVDPRKKVSQFERRECGTFPRFGQYQQQCVRYKEPTLIVRLAVFLEMANNISFTSLPAELLEEIFVRLDISSVHNVLLSCQRFHEVARRSPRIWRALCRRLGRGVAAHSDLRIHAQHDAELVPEGEPYRAEKLFLAKLLGLRRSVRRGSCKKLIVGRNGRRALVPSTSEEVIARTKIS